MAAKKGVKGADKVLDAAQEPIEGAAIDQQERASFGNYGGATRQKIELQPLIDKLLEDVRRIDGDESLSRSEKTKRIGRLADSLKVKLYEDKRRKEEDKLRASSYRRYLPPFVRPSPLRTGGTTGSRLPCIALSSITRATPSSSTTWRR